MNVLSLFDGISCGMIALERAGIKVDNYYASEIDPYAINISEKNYPNIIRLGDVTKWREWEIDWASIDLLIGGSPCQGFSFAGKMLNFEDERSKLFFEFVDILNHIKTVNPCVKFMLENVKMKKEHMSVITERLGVNPVSINSRIFSAQNRPRIYWANWEFNLITEECNLVLRDIMQPLGEVDCSFFHNRTVSDILNQKFVQAKNMIQNVDGKCSCVMARDYKDPKSVVQDGVLRRLTPLEYERLQTVPDGYTEGVAKSHRYKAIGNGWTVDVIAHILKYIKED